MSHYEEDYPSEEYTSEEEDGADQHHEQQYYSTPLTPTRYYYGNDDRQTLPTIAGTPNRPDGFGEEDDDYDEDEEEDNVGDIPLRSSLSPQDVYAASIQEDVEESGLIRVNHYDDEGDEEEEEIGSQNVSLGGDAAVLDLEEMEQLQDEAEKMKGLGNKHMAAQEFTRAYNAYSAALKLSPVGPSSHVFLSNRAAALLSLKKYSAAAVDARRAIALAPTFGKAHARLGQALYFLKDYEGAVEAYEDAVHYEPDNAVTWTYLSKAKAKLEKAEDRRMRRERGEEVSIAETESYAPTVVNSIATDPNKGAAVVTQARGGSHRNSSAMMRAVAGGQALSPVAARAAAAAQAADMSETDPSPMPLMEVQTDVMGPGKVAQQRPLSEQFDGENGVDADFEEAARLYDRASTFLSHKQYRAAVDEFSAALFLVPDDENLSSRLHIGRAHALNGSKRHESAVNDARLSLKLQPDSPEAYSVLAQSHFYLKEYEEAVEAFENCQECLGPNEELSVFDQAYLQKARECLKEESSVLGDDNDDQSYMSRRSLRSSMGRGTVVPKLKPPRFVSREEVIASTPNMPPMPKAWPQQTPTSPTSFRVGPERKVTFLSEAMGMKLNRGCDGIVRVLSVSQPTASNTIIREGEVGAGDVLREAAGVDIRRPITNIMWGDTVALIKMAPRPITVIVAKELSEPPPSVLEEMAKAAGNGTEQSMSQSITSKIPQNGSPSPVDVTSGAKFVRSSPASGEESVADSIAALDKSDEIVGNSEYPPSQTDDSGELDPKEKEEADAAKSQDIGSQEENVNEKSSIEGDEAEDNTHRQGREVEDDTKIASSPISAEDTVDTPNMSDDRNEIAPSSSIDDQVMAVDDHVLASPEEYDEGMEDKNLSADMCLDDVRVPPDAAFTKCKEASALTGEVSTDQPDTSATSTPGQPEIGYTTYPRSEEPAAIAPSKSEEEIVKLEGEILFDPSVAAAYGWTNEKWLSSKSTRALFHSGLVTRLTKGKYFFSGETFVPRTLALFKNPDLILVLRLPKSIAEVRNLVALPNDLDVGLDGKAILIESFLVVESVIDPKTCKLRLSPLTTATSITGAAAKGLSAQPSSNMHYPRRRTCFELITPTENILLSAVVSNDESRKNGPEVSYSESRPFMETTIWEAAIAKLLHAAHGPSAEDVSSGRILESDQSWKHQIVLGTLHSYVVSGEIAKLQQVLETLQHLSEDSHDTTARKGNSSRYIDADIIDAKDESCRTALHYACFRRSSSAVRLLVNAGANCSIPVLSNMKTPCHLSAERLDEKSLSMMLAVSYPARSDPNALDCEGRTPMYTAVVEGRAVGGASNSIALGLCLSALEAWGGHIIQKTDNYALPHPVHCVASEWRSSDLDVVLSHCRYLYPLDEENRGRMSISVLFNYPVHVALISLRKRLMMLRKDQGNHEFGVDQAAEEPALVSTLKVLFKHGFEPNERIEAKMKSGTYAVEMNRMFGFTPFQILLVAALEAQETIGTALDDQQTIGPSGTKNGPKRTKPINASMIRAIMNVLQGAAEVLLRNGARTNVEPPPIKRSSNSEPMPVDPIPEGSDVLLPAVDRATIKIEENNSLMEMLGGENLLRSARAHFASFSRVNKAASVVLNRAASSGTDSDTAGGEDDGSCALCWKEFGMIMNRRHTCRSSQRHVCDDCSSKRVVGEDRKEHRVSDGQFLLARAEYEKAEKEDQKMEEEKRRQRKLRIARAQAGRSTDSREAADVSSIERNELFSGAMKSVSNFIMGETEEQDSIDGGLSGVTSSIGQARDALNERGDKLNSLADKTAALKDASRDFEQMAKELERAQRGFW